MKLGGNRPPGDNPLLFSISGTGSFICTDEAGHTKAFDYPVAEHWGGEPKCSNTKPVPVAHVNVTMKQHVS